jgi:hypothetical protein
MNRLYMSVCEASELPTAFAQIILETLDEILNVPAINCVTAMYLLNINISQRITAFLDFIHRPVFWGVETRRFGNWI